MSALISTARLNAERLDFTVNAFCPETTPFAILERPDRIYFPGNDEDIAWATWPHGRVFGTKAELRWEQQGEEFNVILFRADGEKPPAGFEEIRTLEEPGPGQEEWFYLWGENDLAIGGRLHYSRALPGEGRAQLGITRYTDNAGRLIFYRYVGLRREPKDARKTAD